MRHPVSRGVFAAAVLSLLALIPEPASASDRLTLRVNDARGGPGDLVAVVVRTYASRPIGQGQLCIGARRTTRAASTALLSEAAASTDAPFVKLERAEVFSAKGDARFSVSFDEQEATLKFNSPTGSINAADGPLAVLYFRLSNAVTDGQVFEISVDVSESTLFDGSGQRIEIESKPGRLEIRDDGQGGEDDELEVKVSAGRVKAGKVARVTIGTGAPIALASGRIALRYDPKLASGRPWVKVDPRYGKATVVVNTDTPGLVTIVFQSPDKSLNRVPGDLFEVRLPVSRQAPRGRTALTFDRTLTFARDDDGDLLDLKLTNGTLIVR